MHKDIYPITLTDISTIIIDSNLPKQEKIAAYLRQIKTPRHYKYKKFTIIERHPADGPTIEDSLKGMIG